MTRRSKILSPGQMDSQVDRAPEVRFDVYRDEVLGLGGKGAATPVPEAVQATGQRFGRTG